MDDLVFEGSNDLSSWTTLTEPTFKTLSWQNLPSQEEGATATCGSRTAC